MLNTDLLVGILLGFAIMYGYHKWQASQAQG